MEVFNLFDGDLERSRDEPPGYRWRSTQVSRRLGAARIGGSLYELQPGEKSFPHHYHYGQEEWLLVVAGTPTLRDDTSERELGPGDVVCFPEGPEGAHQVLNRSDAPVRMLMLSIGSLPGVAVYPDSDKIAVMPPNRDDMLIAPRSAGVDYWTGE